MAYSLDELDLEFTQNTSDEWNDVKLVYSTTAKKRKKSVRNRVGDILFYGALTIMLLIVYAFSQSSSTGMNLFGVSFYNVLTESMQSVIPAGSLIVTLDTEGSELAAGDDITFFADETKIVTHRIVSVYADYEGSGQYAFQTKGTENPNPDTDVVYEKNVIGKVVWHAPVLGWLLNGIANNVLWVMIIFAGVMILSYLLRYAFTKEDAKDEEMLSPEEIMDGIPRQVHDTMFRYTTLADLQKTDKSFQYTTQLNRPKEGDSIDIFKELEKQALMRDTQAADNNLLIMGAGQVYGLAPEKPLAEEPADAAVGESTSADRIYGI